MTIRSHRDYLDQLGHIIDDMLDPTDTYDTEQGYEADDDDDGTDTELDHDIYRCDCDDCADERDLARARRTPEGETL